MSFKYLKFSISQNNIGILTINKPQALNALNSEVLEELKLFLQDLTDPKTPNKIKALIITGAGKSFVAGADIKEMLGFNYEQAFLFSQRGQKIFCQLESLSLPVIAAVNGFALGGGLELALSCDIILMSEKALLGLPELKLGLIPAFGGTQKIKRTLDNYKAKEMLFSGKIYSAKEVFNMGLGNKVLPHDDLIKEALELANSLLTDSFPLIDKVKKLINPKEAFWSKKTSKEKNWEEYLKTESEEFAKLFNSKKTKEKLQAFLNK